MVAMADFVAAWHCRGTNHFEMNMAETQWFLAVAAHSASSEIGTSCRHLLRCQVGLNNPSLVAKSVEVAERRHHQQENSVAATAMILVRVLCLHNRSPVQSEVDDKMLGNEGCSTPSQQRRDRLFPDVRRDGARTFAGLTYAKSTRRKQQKGSKRILRP